MSNLVRTVMVATAKRRSKMGIFAAIVLAAASLAGASGAYAHDLVDPTTLTPPLKPFRVCYEDGPWVKCDTSGSGSYENRENSDFGLPCGPIFYESATDTVHSTRWYANLLLVERDAQEHIVGSWSLSPTGAGPTVAFAVDDSWHETFLVPGDLSSDSEVNHGSFLRVPALGAGFHESGVGMADGSERGAPQLVHG